MAERIITDVDRRSPKMEYQLVRDGWVESGSATFKADNGQTVLTGITLAMETIKGRRTDVGRGGVHVGIDEDGKGLELQVVWKEPDCDGGGVAHEVLSRYQRVAGGHWAIDVEDLRMDGRPLNQELKDQLTRKGLIAPSFLPAGFTTVDISVPEGGLLDQKTVREKFSVWLGVGRRMVRNLRTMERVVDNNQPRVLMVVDEARTDRIGGGRTSVLVETMKRLAGDSLTVGTARSYLADTTPMDPDVIFICANNLDETAQRFLRTFTETHPWCRVIVEDTVSFDLLESLRRQRLVENSVRYGSREGVDMFGPCFGQLSLVTELHRLGLYVNKEVS